MSRDSVARGMAGSAYTLTTKQFSVHIKPSGDTTGTRDQASIEAAIASLAGRAGKIVLGSGDWYFNDTITVSGYYSPSSGSLGDMSITIAGQGAAGTRLNMVTAGLPLIHRALNAVGFNLEDVMLSGPGTTNAASIGVWWEGPSGGANWKNVWISNFATGARFYDATLMRFDCCVFRANARNVETGYNCDIFLFEDCRFEAATDTGFYIGWRDPAHPTGGLLNNNIVFMNCRFGDNAVAFDIPDIGASEILFLGTYFENNTKLGWFGDASTQTGPSFAFVDCFFTRWQTQTYQLESRNTNQQGTVTFTRCSADSQPSGTLLKLGYNNRLLWNGDNSGLSGTTSGFNWNGANYVLENNRSVYLNVVNNDVVDGAVLGSTVPNNLRMTTGTGKIWEQWSRISGTTLAELGLGQAKVQDFGGNFVSFHGALRPVTPSGVLPTASSTYRGVVAYQEGGVGVADTIVCCMKDSSNNYSWKVVATG